jgi:hypothetical protein
MSRDRSIKFWLLLVFLLILTTIALSGCGDTERPPDPTTRIIWTEVDSPVDSYECFMHRSIAEGGYQGFESTVCFPVTPKCK